jgi:hypothetical protein
MRKERQRGRRGDGGSDGVDRDTEGNTWRGEKYEAAISRSGGVGFKKRKRREETKQTRRDEGCGERQTARWPDGQIGRHTD